MAAENRTAEGQSADGQTPDSQTPDSQTIEGRIAQPPSRRSLLWKLAASLVIASVLVLCVVLPAEFHIDPTGVGKLTGLIRLSGPREVKVVAAAQPTAPAATQPAAISRFYSTPFRTDSIDIRMPVANEEGYELEYKVRMKAGATLIYSWTVEDLKKPDEFYYDFHGESPPKPDVQVMSYKEALAGQSHGTLIAPFDGIHGWYFQNQSEAPVTVHLKMSGFYELITP